MSHETASFKGPDFITVSVEYEVHLVPAEIELLANYGRYLALDEDGCDEQTLVLKVLKHCGTSAIHDALNQEMWGDKAPASRRFALLIIDEEDPL